MINSLSTKEDQHTVVTDSEQQKKGDPILKVDGVSKKYSRGLKRSLFYGTMDILSEFCGKDRDPSNLRPMEFLALDNVSFEIERGAALGLIGSNGSGKTTLLRIISGIVLPDSGSIEVRGRVAPLIALGAGFKPVLSGRENIYANMSLLGLSLEEINERFDDVVAFAEISDALEAPVQTYSSGMRARLGFACAIHTNPDLLLVDEVLAVGDARFRAKCERRLAELIQQGVSFILVSHAFQAILNVCTEALYLSKGKMIAYGDARSIMDQYEEDLFSIRSHVNNSRKLVLPEKGEQEDVGGFITSICFTDENGELLDALEPSIDISLNVGVKLNREIDNLSLFVAIYQVTEGGALALHLSSIYDEISFPAQPGSYGFKVTMPKLGLKPGSYVLRVYLKGGTFYMLDSYEAFNFSVKANRKMNRGLFYQQREWSLHPVESQKLEKDATEVL